MKLLQFFIDDVLQKVVENRTYVKGRIGVWAWETAASFDDVKISGKGIPENVGPAGKLASTWGRIKSIY